MSSFQFQSELLPVSAQEIATFCQANHITYLGHSGSAVRGELREDSDYDVLVEFDPSGRIGLIEYNRIQRQLGDLLSRRVDLVSRAGLNRVIRADVLASTVDLYVPWRTLPQ